MKKFLFIVLILSISGFVFAQQNQEVGAPDPERIGIESAQQLLKEVSVDKFEHDGFWRSRMSNDDGYTTSRLFVGSPANKQPIPDEEGLDIPDQYVLGTRVDFLRRSYSHFIIYPARPIPIEGITKTISMWVAGRNFNHELYVLIQDFFGRDYEFSMGKLNFIGWQKMTATIPPAPADGLSGVAQRSYNYHGNFGIKITGFRIDCDPMEARGSYYIYFDHLTAHTDLFAEHHRDADDMPDGW
ncbi:MAG: flagellar filament outer layer protein FlaA [Treponema sp.]|nr:flagellar filament outer layer protein FlaA [Treponema sp.]